MPEQEVIHLPKSSVLPEGAAPGMALAIPVNIVPAIYTDGVKRGVERAHAFVITTAADYQEAAALMNNLKKFDSTIKALVLEAGRPLRETAAKVTEEGNAFRAPLMPAYELMQGKMATWKRAEDARIAEALRKQQEEQRAAEQARRDAELEKERLLNEAKVKEEAAARKMEEAAASGSAKKMENAIKAGEAAQLLAAQAAAIPVSSIPFVPATEVPRETKAKGVKETRTVVIHSTDVTKLPAAYLLPNETLLKKHLADGINIPGVVFVIQEGISATGR